MGSYYTFFYDYIRLYPFFVSSPLRGSCAGTSLVFAFDFGCPYALAPMSSPPH